jgi:hypothetical protein
VVRGVRLYLPPEKVRFATGQQKRRASGPIPDTLFALGQPSRSIVIEFFLQPGMEVMSKRTWATLRGKLPLLGVLGFLSAASISARAQAPTASPAPPQGKQPAATAPAASTSAAAPTPREKAWGILREALRDDSADKRANAVRALGLLPQTTKQGRRPSLRSRMTKQMSASQQPWRWDPYMRSTPPPNWKKF